MKKLRILVAIIAVVGGLVFCDKVEDNGNFAGQWQLTEWKSLPDGQVKYDKYSRIYYCVQLDLMEFRGLGDSYLTRFHRTADSLKIGTVYHGSRDEIVGIEELAKYGVPSDGGFAIERLSKQALVLSSDTVRLTFRKF